MPVTTKQSISPIYPTFTTPQTKNTPFQNSKLKSIDKPTPIGRYSSKRKSFLLKL